MLITTDAAMTMIKFASAHPYEIGGILASSDGESIDTVVCDLGKERSKVQYVPDVAMLNSVLAQWAKSGLVFKGVFHSHFYGVGVLSEEDITYIERIRQHIPEKNYPLYFPVFVLPDRQFVCYEASDKISGLKKSEIEKKGGRNNG